MTSEDLMLGFRDLLTLLLGLLTFFDSVAETRQETGKGGRRRGDMQQKATPVFSISLTKQWID